MKKIIFLLIAILSLAYLTACRGNDTLGDTDTSVNKVTEQPTAAYTVSNEIYSDETDKRTLSFVYPSFEGIEAAASLNELIFNESRAYMENYITYNRADEAHYTYDVSSVINTYISSKFASFIYKGTFYAEGAAHPVNFAYTLNVDLENGTLLAFENIISDFEEVKTLFRNGEFSLIPSGNSELDSEINKLSGEDLIDAYSDLYGIYPYVYFTEANGEASLALSLETIYALGGHAEFEAALDKVSAALTDEIQNLLKGEE